MSVNSSGGEPNSGVSNFLFGSLFYAAIGFVALATTLVTETEIEPTHVLLGLLGGAAFITVRYLLTNYSLLRHSYTAAVAVSLFILATQNVPGKLAMVAGACFSVIVVSYYLEIHRE